MRVYEIRTYTTREGKEPFAGWLRRITDRRAATAIETRLVRVAIGNFGDHRSCGGGLWELRIHVGPGYRVYYGIEGATVVLLLCGGDKSSQPADIQKAFEYLKDWKERTK